MLNAKDVLWLSNEIMGTIEAMGGEATPKVVALMAADFQVFPKHQLKEALRRVRMESAGKLTPKTLLDQLDALHGRIGGDEAFALVLKARDETQTVVWTDEIAQAWTACAPLLQGRDQVGARMAFKQAYERIVQDARAQLKRPKPLVSIGSDPELRRVAVTQAHEQGFLPLQMALDALEGIAEFDAQQNEFVAIGHGQRVPLLLPAPTGLGSILSQKPVVRGLLSPNVVEHIKQAKAAAAKSVERAKRRKLAQARLERMQLAQRKREIDQAVQQHLSQQQEGRP